MARDLVAEHAVEIGPIMFGPPLSTLWQIAHFLKTSAPRAGSALASSASGLAGFLFASPGCFLGAGNLVAFFRLVLFVGDIDDGFAPKKSSSAPSTAMAI